MHAILKGAAVRPDGYGALHELAMPQARSLCTSSILPHALPMAQAPELPAPLQVWRYRPMVQATIDKVVAQLSLEEKPTIGFHIRGGDKLIEDSHGCAAGSLTPLALAR